LKKGSREEECVALSGVLQSRKRAKDNPPAFRNWGIGETRTRSRNRTGQLTGRGSKAQKNKILQELKGEKRNHLHHLRDEGEFGGTQGGITTISRPQYKDEEKKG